MVVGSHSIEQEGQGDSVVQGMMQDYEKIVIAAGVEVAKAKRRLLEIADISKWESRNELGECARWILEWD